MGVGLARFRSRLPLLDGLLGDSSEWLQDEPVKANEPVELLWREASDNE